MQKFMTLLCARNTSLPGIAVASAHAVDASLYRTDVWCLTSEVKCAIGRCIRRRRDWSRRKHGPWGVGEAGESRTLHSFNDVHTVSACVWECCWRSFTDDTTSDCRRLRAIVWFNMRVVVKTRRKKRSSDVGNIFCCCLLLDTFVAKHLLWYGRVAVMGVLCLHIFVVGQQDIYHCMAVDTHVSRFSWFFWWPNMSMLFFVNICPT